MSARSSRRAASGLWVVSPLLLLGACAVGPTFERPAAPAVTHFTGGPDPESAGVASDGIQQFAAGAPLAADWWRLFQSPEIDGLVRESVAANPGTEKARATLRASQDNLRAGYGVFYPTIDAGAAATRERYSPTNIGQKLPSSLFNLFTLSASVNYALDLFGGQRRLIENLRAQVEVARAAERAAELSLAANVVNTVIASAAYRAELDATEGLLELQNTQVSIAETQASAGTAPYLSLIHI